MAKTEKIISRTQCDFTHVCLNNRCIFRLQSVFGLDHFRQHINASEVLDTAGVSYATYPRFELVSKPYGMGVLCKDFLGGDDE